MEKVAKYFETHPGEDKVFSSSDEFLFTRKDQAQSHANTLEDKAVKEHLRTEAQEPEENAPETKPEENPKEEAPVEAAPDTKPEENSNEDAPVEAAPVVTPSKKK